VGHIRKESATLPLLLLTMYEDEIEVRNALDAGANGVLAKEKAGEHLIPAIEQIASDRVYPSTRCNALAKVELE
jgi:DNA-binding NarL/FixJ family response regulator